MANEAFRRSMTRLDGVFADAGLPGVVGEIYRADRGAADPFSRLEFTHPAILMIELSLVEAMRDAGVEPDCVVGASLGEFAAAAAAGAVSVEDLAAGIARQVALVRSCCEPGEMVAVFGDPDTLTDVLAEPGVEVAAVNSDKHFVLSGAEEALRQARRSLSARDIPYQSLPVEVAFHSARMDGAAQPYRRSLALLRLGQPRLPLVSCTTAGPITEVSPEHFWQVVRSPIRFRDTVRYLERCYGDPVLIDLGPSGTLANFVTQSLLPGTKARAVAVLNPFSPAGRGFDDAVSLARRGPEPKRRGGGTRMRAFVFPGQGSQTRGMGSELFQRFPDLTALADEILGYSVAQLCATDPDMRLNQTEFTQPALFVVNALSYLDRRRQNPVEVDFFAGHSLGEYNALFAAGAFDFGTGLRLVKRRGELMARVTNGGMAAVVGLPVDALRTALSEFEALDIANVNTHEQVVISGPVEAIQAAGPVLTQAGARAYIPLRVSGAFHSRYMRSASRSFEETLAGVDFEPLKTPVIANITGLPYEEGALRQTLAAQLVEPVLWNDTVRYLLGQGVEHIEEIGPGSVLTGLIDKIRAATPPPAGNGSAAAKNGSAVPKNGTTTAVTNGHLDEPAHDSRSMVLEQGTTLGSAAFRQTYGVRHSYVCGSMYRGIASTELVVRACRSGLLAFYGAGGLPPETVTEAVRTIRASVGEDAPFGVSLVHDPMLPDNEEQLVDVLLRTGVRAVEASAFMKVTPSLVRYRLAGLVEDADGSVRATNRVIAKLSRPEVAESFLAAAADRVVKALLEAGKVTPEQARLARRVPMADDICVEGDSGGHTDRRDFLVLLPAIRRLSERMRQTHGYPATVRIGAAGGIGTPEAAAAAFLLGADFVVTGSINLCTVESGISPLVKDMLQQINIQDTDYAPAGDMFELGAQVQVLKRGVFFPARARKLHELYRRYDCLDDIDPAIRQQIEDRYFRRSFDEVWRETRAYFAQRDPREITKAESNPKHKMALVFRWYFGYSQRAAMAGDEHDRLDFQVHCGPALGAFNQWAAGTPLEPWQNRHVDHIAERLMTGAADYLHEKFSELGLSGGRP